MDPLQPEPHKPVTNPQPADRLPEQILKPGESVQLPPPTPTRLVGMPLKPPQSPGAVEQPNTTPPPIETRPKVNLHPAATQANSATTLGPLSQKQQKAMGKLKKLRAHKHWHNAKIIIITMLVFVLLFNSQWIIAQFMYYFNRPSTNTTQTTQPTPQPTPTPGNPTPQPQAEVVGPENILIIPKLNVRVPIVFIDTINEDAVLVALRDGVVHYAGTANPGENGNAVFFGHSSNDWWEPGNYKFIFANLERLAVGDTYEIHFNSRKYVYQVTETKVVNPNDLSVLNQTATPTSTLITCTPPGTSWRRFITFGKQTEPAAAAIPTTPAPSNQNQQQNSTQTLPATNQKQSLPSAPPSLWEQIVNFFTGLFGGKKQTNQNSNTNQNTNNSQNQTQTTQHLPEIN